MQKQEQSGRTKLALVAAILSIFLSHGADAQNINAGEIRGVVTDSGGAAVPNAPVSVRNTQTGVTTTVKSNSDGLYDVPQLTPGTYTINFTVPSFKTYSQQNVLLQAAPITVNAVLEVGDVAQQVTVDSGALVQLQTEDSEQNLTLDETTVTSLPNIGNTWFNETVLIPGVNGGGSQNQNGQGIGINGAESYQEAFLLNGGTVTLIGSQNPDWIIAPVDFISENDFQTHSFNATSGNGLAVLNVITKNGTNRFHGSFWDYNQNAYFSAQNYFSGGSGVSPFSSNTFGGTIGGPIKRDKLFFFAGFQRQLYKAGQTGVASMPTAQMRTGNFAGFPTIYDPASTKTVDGVTTRTSFPNNQIPTADLNQQALNAQMFLPLPNFGPAGATTSNYRYSEQVTNLTYWYTGKIDYNINNQNHINVSGTYGTVNFPNPSATNPIGEYAEQGSEGGYQISHTYTHSSTAINEARFSMIRFVGNWMSGDFNKDYPQKIGIPGSVANVWPVLNITGGYYYGNGLEAILAEGSFVPSDVLTLVRGKHILKFGGEFDAYQVNINFSGYSDGNFVFNGDSTLGPQGSSPGVGYADFMLGDVSNWSIYLTPETGSRLKSYQMFAQDDYKFRPNLTLNLGLRFQIQPGWSEAKNQLGDFDPTLLNPATNTLGAMWYARGANGKSSRTTVENTDHILQPRVGFSWSPFKNWAIRAGFGIYTELLGYNTYAGSAGIGIAGQNSMNSTDGLTPVFTLSQGPPPPVYSTVSGLTPQLFNGQSVSYIPYHTKVPYLQEYQLDVQHELRGGIIVDAAYVGSRGKHLAVALDSNQVPQSELFHFTMPGVNMAPYRPYQQYESISTTLGGGISHYDSLQLRGQKQFAHSLQFVTNFTYSHSLDDGTGSGYGGPGANGSLWQNSYDPKSNYANSLLNQPISFNGDVIYDLPVGQGKLLLNQGGLLNAALGGWRLSGLWQVHSGTPFSVYVPNNLSGSLAGTWFPNRVASGKLSHPTIQKWFDASAFTQPAFGTFGDTSRNPLSGPSWRQLDLSMQKHFALKFLGDLSDLQVRVDAADALNNPNFANPTGALQQSNTATITAANTSRSMQFEAKFSF
jgi:hypothetical protein